MVQNPLLIILGATASGKTKLAVKLADALAGEIISADSRQVFRGMNIGTGKDLHEYRINGKDISYHLIDIKNAGERYNVNEYKEDFYRTFEDLTIRGVLPILCGGTGMYVHSILRQHEYTAVPLNEKLRNDLIVQNMEFLRDKLQYYPEEFRAHADLSTHKRLIRAIEIAEFLMHNKLKVTDRPSINFFAAGLTSSVDFRWGRVIKRLQDRFKQGMIEEVKQLLDSGVPGEMLTFYGLEYKFITEFLFDKISHDDLISKLSTAICQFAKRQMTFFRKMEKDGMTINWFDSEIPSDELLEQVLASFSAWKAGY